MGVQLMLDNASFAKLDQQLAKLGAIDRGQALVQAAAAGGDVVAKRASELAPQPGMPDYTGGRGDERLADNILVKAKHADRVPGAIAVIGADYKKTPHEHLVEEGHRMVTHAGKQVGTVEGKHFLAKAVEQRQVEMKQAINSSLDHGIARAVRS